MSLEKHKALILVGVSASGKTTFSNEMKKKGYCDVNRDWIRFNIVSPDSDWSTYKFSNKNEREVTRIQEDMIVSANRAGKSVVISDTNLNPITRNKWISFCEQLGYEVEIKSFPVSYEEAVKRDRLRPNGVGELVIYKQFQQWNDFIGRKKYIAPEGKSKAVIFDLDGTLAQMWNRGPFEWDMVREDTVDMLVYSLYEKMYDDGYKIIIMSGRDSCCRGDTEEWLHRNGIVHDELYMRKSGDMRKDSIVKEELFWENVAYKYNIVLCVDDRPQVVRLWYEIGIPKVFTVSNPYIEF